MSRDSDPFRSWNLGRRRKVTRHLFQTSLWGKLEEVRALLHVAQRL